jgi:hypothetical protein
MSETMEKSKGVNSDIDNDNDNDKKGEDVGTSKNSDYSSIEECVICQDVLNKPVMLPCSHKYCYNCLEGWRSKYVADKNRTCPQCRRGIPTTKAMLSQLSMYDHLIGVAMQHLDNPPYKLPPLPEEDYWDEAKDDYGTYSEEFSRSIRILPHPQQQELLKMKLESFINILSERLEHLKEQIGPDIMNGGIDVLEEPTEHRCEDLPVEICYAAASNNIEEVLNWLGDPPIPYKRINAQNINKMQRTLLHEAEYECRLDLMRLLLQNNANVDPFSSTPQTPLFQACHFKRLHPAALLLFEWGAAKEFDKFSNGNHHKALNIALESRNKSLVNLLKSPLGDRRCEIFGLESRSDLNGRTCVAVRYFKDDDRYAVRIGEYPPEDDNNEVYVNKDDKDSFKFEFVKVKYSNLKRRDRTHIDPGYVVKFLGYSGKNIFAVVKPE